MWRYFHAVGSCRSSWQVYFYQDAIVRQMVPTLGFFAVAWASKAYFGRRLADGNAFAGTPLIVLLSCVAAPGVMLQQGLRYEGEGPVASIFGLYGAFINNMLIGFVFIGASIYYTRDLRRYLALGFTLLIGVTSHFLQVKLLAGAVVATRFGIRGRKMAIGIAILLITSYAVGLSFIPLIVQRDPNDGLRLAFLADVLRSTADTKGVGVGFGKELVRWRYHFPNRPVFTFLPDPRTMSHARMLEALSTGVHNSFAETLLRAGLPGLILLVASFVAVFPAGDLPRHVQDHAAVAFTMMFIACFVNPALESPIQAVGIGFIYGYLLALRRVRTTRIPSPPPRQAAFALPAPTVPRLGTAP